MDDLVDGDEIDVECDCGASVRATVGEIRKSPTLTCPNGHEIKVDSSQLDEALRPVDRAQSNLDQAFRRIGKRT